ncbi:uncharacterized protein N7498_001742 [Penicillium cinerascens]|uniref:Response regulatory domain-containing protein n=1 Tax=Penicillium cinerascens TaxID=70096 RepID=A0A9W9N8P4_9EURO|nr:uncharacterized protein N7498_001742 [Penicillium cinerascens]KAJ5215335.1 hypothetical protein N7498_001742 [Penicillium cinerascens]
MARRRVWVKRSTGSATLVSCLENAIVDELRDQVILKFANSLGRSFDSPDIVTAITPREGSDVQAYPKRLLGPEEVLSSVLDIYYPGGQTIKEALVTDAPVIWTAKPSPHRSVCNHRHSEPGEYSDCFPQIPLNKNAPSALVTGVLTSEAGPNPSMNSILTVDDSPLPSPVTSGIRHTIDSPGMLSQALGVVDCGVPTYSQPSPAVSAPTMPRPLPAPAVSPQARTHIPPAEVATPRSPHEKSHDPSPHAAFDGLIAGTVPPINVLIVEDNIINQKLLEAFMKRLNVRWKCVADGEDAVRKWRQGGFHLILMDIQLPIMNGLDATKEVRRLEWLNGIGVLPKTVPGCSVSGINPTFPPWKESKHRHFLSEEDALADRSMFHSPTVIVALTASSLQSDRQEALTAGCNDFLTKPVRFPWLKQKVTEWGCMQALIDVDGWRKWRGFMDSSPISSESASIDNEASPLQVGNNGGIVPPMKDENFSTKTEENQMQP